MNETYASYGVSKFSLNLTNLKYENNSFNKSDTPAFVHEYCHYIQDISTISAIVGFHTLLTDIAEMTTMFSEGEGKIYSIPATEHPFGRFRKVYNLYCGDDSLDINSYEIESIEMDEFAFVNSERVKIKFKNSSKYFRFGILALQESQAFYIQSIIESKIIGTNFSININQLPVLPYKICELLFDYYRVSCSKQLKFLGIGLFLDTINAASLFVKFLMKFANMEIKDIETVKNFINDETINEEQSVEQVLKIILADFETWSNDPTRPDLREAMRWYMNTIILAYKSKWEHDSNILFASFLLNMDSFKILLETFPPPIIQRGNFFYRYSNLKQDATDNLYNKQFDCAATFWLYRMVYDLLKSETTEQLDRYAVCPLFESCEHPAKQENEYSCKRSPWLLAKYEGESLCPYGRAAYAFGLRKNDLEIEI